MRLYIARDTVFLEVGRPTHKGMATSEQLRSLELPVVTKTSRKEPIGTGSYANVYEVMVHETVCAAKEMHPILMSETKKRAFLAECVQCSRILHPNVVQFLGIHYPSPDAQLPWLVMELMYISLTGLIEKYEKEDFPFHFKLSILMETCQGIQFLHSRNIIHRDLSSNNVLLTRHLVAKIGDLGVAKVISPGLDRYTQAPGTIVFMPPEALSVKPVYGPSIDVFSVGCVCVHIMSLQWPIPSDRVTANNIVLSEIQRREGYFTNLAKLPLLKCLVEQCLQNKQEERPVIGEVIKRLKDVNYDHHPHEDDSVIELFKSVDERIIQKDQQLKAKDNQLVMKDQQLSQKDKMLYQKDQQLSQKDQQLTQKDHQLTQKDHQLTQKDHQLCQKDEMMSQIGHQEKLKDHKLAQKDQLVSQKDEELRLKYHEITEKDFHLRQKDQQLGQKDQVIQKKDEEISQKDRLVHQKDEQLRQKDQEITKKDLHLRQKDQQLDQKDQKLKQKDEEIAQKDQLVSQKDERIKLKDQELIKNDQQLRQKDQQLRQKDQEIAEKDRQLSQKDQQLKLKDQELNTKVKLNQGKFEKVQQLGHKDQLQREDEEVTQRDQTASYHHQLKQNYRRMTQEMACKDQHVS